MEEMRSNAAPHARSDDASASNLRSQPTKGDDSLKRYPVVRRQAIVDRIERVLADGGRVIRSDNRRLAPFEFLGRGRTRAAFVRRTVSGRVSYIDPHE